MPRPTRTRTSLPSHTKAPRLSSSKPTSTPDDLDDSYMMQPEEMQPISAVVEAAAADAQPAQTDAVEEGDKEPRPPKEKQTKAEKAYSKRKALLEKLSARTTPYSKSHARRLRRAAKPENNLVASLSEVEAVLPEVERLQPEQGSDEDEGMDEDDEEDQMQGKGKTGGKGKEKLTAKKRQRVLTAESARLPAIIKNESFASSPFATIRQHTLNTLVTQKNPSLQQQGKKGKKGGK
ncbi:hypothetical protein JCM10207_004424 [Rhodosporidiobolus poonsookiae]